MEILHRIQRAFIRLGTSLLLEGPARRRGMDQLIKSLEQTGQAIEKRAAAAAGHSSNQRALAHIIGIERWGQHRLQVALGEPLVLDEYDDYRPASDQWTELVKAFRVSRQGTIGLGKTLRMAGVDSSTPVEHNQFGAISLLGWFYYLDLHARLESLRINETNNLL